MRLNQIKICGEWQAVRDLARQSGCDIQKSRELLMAMRNAFKKVSSDVDVFVSKPREINVTGAHINNAIVKNNLAYADICQLQQKADPNAEVLGSLIAATPEKVCKGIFIPPTKNLLEGYIKAAEKLSQSDFTVAANRPGAIQYIN